MSTTAFETMRNPTDPHWDTPLSCDDEDELVDLYRAHGIAVSTVFWDDGYGPFQCAWSLWAFAYNNNLNPPGGVTEYYNEQPYNWSALHSGAVQGVPLIGAPSRWDALLILTAVRDRTPFPNHLLRDPRDRNAKPHPVRAAPITDQQREDAVARYVSGESLESIARDLGMAPTTVSRSVKKAGHVMRPANEFKVPPNTRQHIANKYQSGISTVKLAAEFGLAQSTVTDIIVEQGVQIRTRGKRLGPAEQREVAALYHAGHTSPQIARQYEISKQTVMSIVRKHSSTTRP